MFTIRFTRIPSFSAVILITIVWQTMQQPPLLHSDGMADCKGIQQQQQHAQAYNDILFRDRECLCVCVCQGIVIAHLSLPLTLTFELLSFIICSPVNPGAQVYVFFLPPTVMCFHLPRGLIRFLSASLCASPPSRTHTQKHVTLCSKPQLVSLEQKTGFPVMNTEWEKLCSILDR